METHTMKRLDKQIIVKDATICYEDHGIGLTPIIFIHGFPFDKSSWQPQVDFFQKNFRVITYDIRGFGKSSSGNEKPSINQFADDLINFMDLLEIPKAIVCGLSMGGYILLNAVKRYPGRFIAIALSDTQCVADTTEVKAKRKNLILQLNTGGIEEFIEGFIKNIFCDATKMNSKEVIGEVKKMMQSTSLSTLTGTLNALAQREETCTYLQEISIPALIICGKEDIVTPPAQSEFMNLHIINSVLKIIDKAGHMSNLEQTEEFNKHLNEFFNGLN